MDLEQLRDQLSGIDRQILELVAERQRASGDIGTLKRATGRPTRDFVREKQVLNQARALAGSLGVPPGLAEALLSLLIRSSLANQEQARVRAEGQGSGKPALVIGGSGKMGRWFTEFLHSQGFNVLVADPAGPTPGFRQVADWRGTPDEFAVTVVSVPIHLTGAILRDLGERRRSGLIFDISSLKSPFIPELTELSGLVCAPHLSTRCLARTPSCSLAGMCCFSTPAVLRPPPRRPSCLRRPWRPRSAWALTTTIV